MEKTNKFGAVIPNKISNSFLKTLQEIEKSEMFLTMYLIGNEYLIRNKEEVSEGLTKMYDGQEPNPIIEMTKSGKINGLFDSKTFELFYGQMCVARTIDNVLTYFKDILSEIVIKKPQILRSKESERLDFIFKYDTMEELQIAIAEKKIEALFYAGFDKIEAFFKERIGVNIFTTEKEKKDFNDSILCRNLIVHNRGIITKEFLVKTGNTTLKIGDTIHCTYENISHTNVAANNFILTLDGLLIEKFNLESHPFNNY
jgi:hypothetical protein